MDDFVGTAIRDLTPAWNRITKVSFIPESVEFSAQFVQIAASVFATFQGDPDEWSRFAARSAQVRWDGKADVRMKTYGA